MAETIFEALQVSAAAAPDNVFICVPEDTSYARDGLEWTYAEVLQRVADLADRYEQAGYGLGHRVALLLENRPEYFIHLFALNAVGASVVPVNPDHRHAELKYLMAHCGAVLVVALGHHIARVRAVAAELEQPLAIIELNEASERLPAAPQRVSARPLNRATEAAVFYTSGTTGQPKGCLVTNDYWLSAGEWALALAAESELFTIEPGRDRLFNPLPVFHVHAGVVALMPMLLSRGCLIRPEHFAAKRWWTEVAASRATIVHYIGVIPQALLALEGAAEERAHYVRFGFGAGMDGSLHAQFESRFGFPHVEVWGMTEVGRWTVNDHEPRHVGSRAIGRPMMPMEAKVFDDNDREAAENTEGELVVRLAEPDPRRGFFAGYLNDDAATETGWRGGWWHTGDIVRQDDSGMVYFVDRKKNMIRRSGENIAAAEVEAVLYIHPAVGQIAVLPVADEKCGEEILACIVPSADYPADAELAKCIFDYCNEQLAYYKAPGWILFLERMPVTATQKVNKAQIFPHGEDPRGLPGAIDLRSNKRRDYSPRRM